MATESVNRQINIFIESGEAQKVYDKLIEVTNRQLDTDIIKKIEARLSKSWQQKKKWVLRLFAGNTAAPWAWLAALL